MKKHFTNIVLTFICLIVLPLTLSAADGDSDVKLNPAQQKLLDNTPPEHREKVRKTLVENQKQMQMTRSAMKKIMPRIMSRLPKLIESVSDRQQSFDLFMQDATAQQEFRDYVGIDKELADSIVKKQMAEMGKMFEESQTSIFKDIANAKTDEEVNKLADQFVDKQIKMMKDINEVTSKELKPQQIEKLKELRVVNSSPNDKQALLFDFGQYETLNLTDEQKKKIVVIRTEYFVEFEPIFKKILEIQQRQMDRMFEEGGMSPNEDIQKETEEATQPLIKLNAATRARILALFTKEQTERLDKILSNAPKYLAVRVGLIKENEDKDAWKKSWKPGDPIPEGAVPPANPNRIFPIGM